MARSIPPDRLAKLVEAAREVFTDQGYRRTRMADIAARMEIAPGTLYLYVEGKEALFHLVVSSLLDAHDPEAPLPLRNAGIDASVQLLRERAGARMARPLLKGALTGPPPPDVRSELEQIVDEQYELINGSRHLLALVERSTRDLPELLTLYFVEGRREFHADLTRYVQRRIDDGSFRPVPDAKTAARFLNESVTWFARHRLSDADSADIDDDVARATCIDMLTEAFLP